MTAVETNRKPGTRSLFYGLIALPVGVVLLLVLAKTAPDAPAAALIGLLIAASGLVALVVGGVRRLIAH